MALKARLSKDDHAKLAAALQAEYKADGESFVLDVTPDGDLSLHSSANLSKALEAERAVTGDLRKQVKAFEGLDAAEARDAVKNRDLYKTGADERTKKLEEKYSGENAATKAAHEADRARFLKHVKTQRARAAIAAAKGDEVLLLPHVLPLLGVNEKGDDFEDFVVDEKGAPRFTKIAGGSGNMTAAELLAGMRTDERFARAFYSDQKSGNGAPPAGSGGGSGGGGGTVIDAKDHKAVLANFDAIADGKVGVKTAS